MTLGPKKLENLVLDIKALEVEAPRVAETLLAAVGAGDRGTLARMTVGMTPTYPHLALQIGRVLDDLPDGETN